MTTKNELIHCLNCGRSEETIPLVNLRYAGKQAWICSQCLPILIHRPGQLAGKMANAENFASVDSRDS